VLRIPLRLTDDAAPGASRRRRAAVLALLAFVAAALHAAAGGPDRRVRVDPDSAPWRAVGKLQAVSENFRQTCTGTLVGPALVLSAAHCLFNPRTGRFFPPGSVHFLIGYAGGRYAGHAVGTAVEVGAGYDRTRPKETLGSDWALIQLDQRLGSGDRVLPMLRESPPVAAAVVLGGYQRDHPLVLIADIDCRVLGRAIDVGGRALLRHSCAGLPGLSGAPLLIEVDGTWHVSGVAVAEEAGAASGLAALPDPTRALSAGSIGPP
jgi:protease YdgD